jgi:hypothetical protein
MTKPLRPTLSYHGTYFFNPHLFSQLGSRFSVIQQRSTHLSD